MIDPKHSPKVFSGNTTCPSTVKCNTPLVVDNCGEEECNEFRFATPSILYAGCACPDDQTNYQLFQVVTDDEGVSTECLVGTVKGTSPFHREFRITGEYVVKWCTDKCSPCEGAGPDFHTAPLAENAMSTVDWEDRCNPETNTIWRRTVLFTATDPTDPSTLIETVVSDVDTGVVCRDVEGHADVEHLQYCNPDGFLYTKSVYHIFNENGIPTAEIVLKDWEKTDQRCIEECVPYTADSYGVASPSFEPFRSFTIIKPECCDLVVTTSAGTITLRKGETNFTSSVFACDLTSISISGDCVDKTHIIVQS